MIDKRPRKEPLVKCPSCTETTLMLSERQGIEIDYCPECRGVWLDRGELDKLIERSASAETAPRAAHDGRPEPRRSSRDDDGHRDGGSSRTSRKRSLLGEIFDFG